MARRSQQIPSGRHGLSRADVDRHQRERILEALAETIVLAGYQAASVGIIHDVAQVSRVTFYDHFAGKEDAYLAFYEIASAAVLETIDHAASCDASSPARQVARAMVAFLHFAAAQPEMVQAWLTAVGPVSARVVAHRAASRRALERRLAAAVVAAGGKRPSDTALEISIGGACEVVRSQIATGGGDAVVGLAPDIVEVLLLPLAERTVASAARREAVRFEVPNPGSPGGRA